MKPCQADGCDRPHRARGYCRTHYHRRMRGSHMDGRWPALLADIRAWRAAGLPWPIILADLGTTATALERRAHRHGERDLARSIRTLQEDRSMTPATCSFDGCDRPVKCRALCEAHYNQWKRHGECKPLSIPGGQRKGRLCGFEGCGRPHYGNGYCIGHRKQYKAGKTLTPLNPRQGGARRRTIGCSVDGCDAKHWGLGYCRTHYSRQREGRPMDGTRPVKTCTVDGCDAKHFAKGMCRKHYEHEVWAAKSTGHREQAERTCTLCDAKHYGNGYCQRHYQQAKRDAKRKANPRPEKPKSNLPDGWDKVTKPKPTPIRADERNDESITWTLMSDEQWTDLAATMRDKLQRWGDADLIDMLGVAA